MTGLTLITGDALEVLLARMDADLAAAPLAPFEEERIVVQSLGMERWVRQQLALRRGCAASLELPFPAAFCRTLATGLQRDRRFGAVAGTTIDVRFEEQALTWRMFALLQDQTRLQDPVYEPLRAYLHEAAPAKAFGLAQRVAARFDEYRLYRPELLTAWEDGATALTSNPHEAWQAALWRRLLGNERPAHFARWFLQTVERLETLDTPPDGLPARVSVFGVSTLPPLFVRLLRAVSRFVPVRFYVLLPDGESWQAGAARHPLFETFGQASRDLLTDIMAGGVLAGREHLRSTHASGTAPALLAHVQRTLHDGAAAAYALTPSDRSLTVHVCHSPQRELEVLRDQLLDAFAADATLRPHDVLVMTPDVEAYAPLAEAIFGHPRVRDDGRPVIPFRIADRTLARESPPARAFLAFLALGTARLTATEVSELLTHPMVRRAAGIAPAQLDQITAWLEESAVRWGVDGATREAWYGVPPFEENSWRRGLDRLLGGYAAGRTEALVSGVLPVAGDLAGDTELLGNFAEWVESLVARLAALREARPLAAWTALLQETLRWLVAAEGHEERTAIDRITRDLERLGELTDPLASLRGASFAADAPVTFDVVHNWVADTLADDEQGSRFLSGGLTLCAMKPMRAIPHRVVAVLGLDDRAYPRRIRRAAFDVIGSDPQRGDRDPRADDRQLILDTLLSAGDRLILSYVGRSQQDNTEIAPSIVLNELLDRLDAMCPVPIRPSTWVRVEHALQPFSPSYFVQTTASDQPTRFSFDGRLAASLAGAGARTPAPPFLAECPELPPLTRDSSQPTEPFAEFSVQDLVEAWTNPSRRYCRRTLQLSIETDDASLDDVEPMSVDALRRTVVQQEMLERVLAGAEDARWEALQAVSRGDLPPGALGPEWYAELRRELAPVLNAVRRFTFTSPFIVDVTGPDWRLRGHLPRQCTEGQVSVRAASLKTKDRARAWIAHVIRNAAGGPVTTHVISKDAPVTLAPLDDAVPLLDLLVQGARRSLQVPLPFFLEASYRWQEKAAKGEATLDVVRRAFLQDDGWARGDIADPYVARLWRGRSPIDECTPAFVALAEAFWGPFAKAVRT